MKSKLFILVALFTMLGLSSCGYERIDAGHEGIKVNLYGSEKGVDDVSLVTGAVWYNPFMEQVFEYPTFVQTVDYPAFEVNSKDGSKFTVDPSMIMKIKDGKTPVIFKKYRKELKDILSTAMFVYIKDAARIEFNNYNADEIVSNRSAVDRALEDRVREVFDAEGFDLQQLTPGIGYPSSYEEAINAKNKAVQDKLKVENEVAVAKAQAEKLLVAAKAEAEANKLREQALTPAILEKMWIEKWSGEVPTVITGNNTSTFLDLDKLRRK